MKLAINIECLPFNSICIKNIYLIKPIQNEKINAVIPFFIEFKTMSTGICRYISYVVILSKRIAKSWDNSNIIE